MQGSIGVTPGCALVPLLSRNHISAACACAQEFNAAVLDYLIVSDDALQHITADAGQQKGHQEGSDAEEGDDGDEDLVPRTSEEGHVQHQRKRRRLQQAGLRGVKNVLHVDPPSHASEPPTPVDCS